MCYGVIFCAYPDQDTLRVFSNPNKIEKSDNRCFNRNISDE